MTGRQAATGRVRRVTLLLGAIAIVATAGAFAAGPAAAAVKRPAILAVSVSPRSLPPAGGSVTVTVQAAHARGCAVHGQHLPLASQSVIRTASCAAGRARFSMPVAANPYSAAQPIHFSVRVTGAKGVTVTRAVQVTEAGKPAPPPLQLSPVAVADGSVGAAYSSAVAATGGTLPYTWQVIGGALPAGIALGADGTLTGTPVFPGKTSFLVGVHDAGATAQTAQENVTVTVTGSPPPAIGTSPASSTNWSGFASIGGPFTSATGTFNIPAISPSAADSMVAEWVGIDGATNQSLIQAGADEEYQVSTGQTLVFVWWEILPAPATPILMPVAPGDQITVSIFQQAAGQWVIDIVDSTNGNTWQTQVGYGGPATSAEWIVEAPTLVSTNQVVALSQFSPNVTFTGLGVTGPTSSMDQITLFQNGAAVATPSTLDPNGFTVAYGSVAPGPP